MLSAAIFGILHYELVRLYAITVSSSILPSTARVLLRLTQPRLTQTTRLTSPSPHCPLLTISRKHQLRKECCKIKPMSTSEDTTRSTQIFGYTMSGRGTLTTTSSRIRTCLTCHWCVYITTTLATSIMP